MSKVTIEFDMDDFEKDDRIECERALKAKDLCAALWDIQQMIRGYYRHPEPFAKEEDVVEKIQEDFFEILSDNGINLDKLYS